MIKEPWRPADLLQFGLSEGLINDQVQDSLLHVVVLVDKLIIQVDRLTCRDVNLDLHIITPEVDVPDERLWNLVEGEDVPASRDEWPNRRFDLLPFGAKDANLLVGLPELLWRDIQAVLEDHQVRCQGELVQIRGDLNLVRVLGELDLLASAKGWARATTAIEMTSTSASTESATASSAKVTVVTLLWARAEA